MNFQSLKQKIVESRGLKGSFDDAVSEVKPELVQIITQESFGVAQIVEAVRKYSNKKVTNQLIEEYHEAASSKEFSTDPVVLDLISKSQFKVGNKYIFVMEGKAFAISEDTIKAIQESGADINSIEDIKNVITERVYG